MQARVRGYARVSFIDKDILEKQITQIKEYCTSKNLELINIYENHDVDNRSGTEAFVKTIKKGDHIIISDLFLLTSLEFAIIMHESCNKKAYVTYLSHHEMNANDIHIKATLAILLAFKILEKETGNDLLPYISNTFNSNDPTGQFLSTITVALKNFEGK